MKVCTCIGLDKDRKPVLVDVDVEAKTRLFAFVRNRLSGEWHGFPEGFVAALRQSLSDDGCQVTRGTDAVQYLSDDVDAMNAISATLPRGPHYNDVALISVAIPLDFAAETDGVVDGVYYMRGHGYPIAAVHPSEFSCSWHPDTGVLVGFERLDD